MSDNGTQVCRVSAKPKEYLMGIESGQFDVTELVADAINCLPWNKLASLALREHIMELVRSVDFKPIIDSAVRLYVEQTLHGVDINDTGCSEYVKSLAKHNTKVKGING